MKPLEVISVNLWQIIISLLNLLILYLLAKRFFFRPVERMILKRQTEIDKQYTDAENCKTSAEESKQMWEEKLSALKTDSEEILKNALNDAKQKSEKLIEDASEKAEDIVRKAKKRAENELEKAESEIKQQIVDVSLVLAKEILMREISKKDNSVLINSFIEGLDKNYEGNR